MKAALRSRVQKLRTSAKVSDRIQQRILDAEWWAMAFQVGLYRSTPAEPSTERVWRDVLARQARVAVPVRQGDSYRWGWVDGETRWRKGAHGILEPEKAPAAASSELQIFLVPGAAFDIHGGRLGRGGGHFDRLLSGADGLRVGLCPEARLMEAVPREAHDAPMDVVVTEQRVIYAATAAAKLEKMIGAAWFSS